MSFVERFSILCLYLGESTIEGSAVDQCAMHMYTPAQLK